MITNRKIDQKQGIVDNNGNITIKFDPPPQGFVLTGSITVTGSPPGVTWSVLAGGLPIDTIFGAGTSAQVQCVNNEQISISTSALIPGTVIQASYVSSVESEATAAVVNPSHDSFNPLASYTRLVFTQVLNVSGATFVGIPLQPSDRSIIVMIENSTTCFIAACVGQTTGTDYFAITKPLAGVQALNKLGSALTGPYVIPVPGAIENAVNLSVVGPTSGSATIVVYATPDVYAGLNFNEPLNVTIFDPNATTVAYTNTKANAGTGLTTTLLGVPAANFWWEISHMGLWQVQAGTTFNQIRIQGHTTLNEYLSLILQSTGPGNVGQIFATGHIQITEGLDLVNVGTGVTCSAMVLARPIPQTYSGPT